MSTPVQSSAPQITVTAVFTGAGGTVRISLGTHASGQFSGSGHLSAGRWSFQLVATAQGHTVYGSTSTLTVPA
ncbi:MAG: hypothetical protein ABI140_04330 [Jatrophihabitantaceae bacterium]